jgi:hypothetical protein
MKYERVSREARFYPVLLPSPLDLLFCYLVAYRKSESGRESWSAVWGGEEGRLEEEETALDLCYGPF